jgi:hypothetical protein
MLLIFCSCVSRNTQINEKRLFVQSKHLHLLLSFLFVFVGPTEHCSLENLGNHLARNRCGRPSFSKKRKKKVHFFVDVKWMLT